MTAASDWRDTITERMNAYVDNRQGRPPFGIVPPQLIEAQIDLESGGDPNLIDPGGARGLGQIVPGGREYDHYKEVVNPNLTPDDLLNPKTNIDIMLYGMADRQYEGTELRAKGEPGAYADWYMSAAGYLGGATEYGFNTSVDTYGTSGADYVRKVHNYIETTWGAEDAQWIDDLNPGSVEAAGGDWKQGALSYNPKAKSRGDKELLSKLMDGFDSGLKAVEGAYNVLTDLPGIIAEYAPRAGIGVLGIVVLGLGVALMLRPS